MYDRKRAWVIAIEESKIPKDKVRWYCSDKKLIATEEDSESFRKLKKIEENATEFVENGGSLFIYSREAGNGKTTWATRIAMTYIKQFILSKSEDTDGCPVPRVMFVNVPEYLMNKRLAINNRELAIELQKLDKRIATASLVVWDDVASKGFTENEDMMLYLLLNSRIEHNKANIFTSNVLKENLTDYVSGTVASRMINSDDNCIQVFGTGKRGMV